MLHIGLCLPTSCSDMEISNLTQLYLDSNLLSAQNVFEHHPEVIHVKDLNLSSSFYEKTSVKIIGYQLFKILTINYILNYIFFRIYRSFIVLTMIALIISALNEPKQMNECKTIPKETNNNADEDETITSTDCNKLNHTNVPSITNNDNESVNKVEKKNQMFVASPLLVERSNIEKVIDCFSLTENFKSLSKTSIAPNSIPVINGFKYDKNI